jgi:hypothetical protein
MKPESLFHWEIEVVAKLAVVKPVEVVRTAVPFWVIVPEALKAPFCRSAVPLCERVEVPESPPVVVAQYGKLNWVIAEELEMAPVPPVQLPFAAAVMMPEELTVRFVQVYELEVTPEFTSEKVVLPFVTLEVTFPLPARVKVVPVKPLITTEPPTGVEVVMTLPFPSTARNAFVRPVRIVELLKVAVEFTVSPPVMVCAAVQVTLDAAVT